VASLAFGAGGHRDEAGGLQPPPASPAPMPKIRARHWYSASGSGFGSRHGVFLLSLSYISLLFSFSCIDRQLSLFVLSLLLSTIFCISGMENVPLKTFMSAQV